MKIRHHLWLYRIALLIMAGNAIGQHFLLVNKDKQLETFNHRQRVIDYACGYTSGQQSILVPILGYEKPDPVQTCDSLRQLAADHGFNRQIKVWRARVRKSVPPF